MVYCILNKNRKIKPFLENRMNAAFPKPPERTKPSMNFPISHKNETDAPEISLAAESKIPPVRAAVYTAAIWLLCLAAYFTGGLLFPVCGVLASALYAVLLLRSGEIVSKLLGTAVILLLWPVTQSFTVAFFFSFLFLPAGLGFAVSFRQRGGFATAMASSLVFSAVFMIPLACLAMAEFTSSFSLAELLNHFRDIFKNILFSVFQNLPEELLSTLFPLLGFQNVSEFTDMIYAQTAYSLPSHLCLFFLAIFSGAYWIFKALCVRSDTPQARDSYFFMGKFCLFRVYMFSCLPMFFSLENEDAMFFSNLSTIFSYVFAYAGIALVDYFLYRRIKAHPAVRVTVGIFLAGLCVLPFGFCYIISFAGLADACWNLRRFISAKEGTVL